MLFCIHLSTTRPTQNHSRRSVVCVVNKVISLLIVKHVLKMHINSLDLNILISYVGHTPKRSSKSPFPSLTCTLIVIRWDIQFQNKWDINRSDKRVNVSISILHVEIVKHPVKIHSLPTPLLFITVLHVRCVVHLKLYLTSTDITVGHDETMASKSIGNFKSVVIQKTDLHYLLCWNHHLDIQKLKLYSFVIAFETQGILLSSKGWTFALNNGKNQISYNIIVKHESGR
jgi:hypothetical protein